MKTQTFTANISQEGELFIAQCLEVDIVSQGKNEDKVRTVMVPKHREVKVGTTFYYQNMLGSP